MAGVMRSRTQGRRHCGARISTLICVLAAVGTSERRGFAARTRHAAGLAALAQGNYVTAYARLPLLSFA